MRRLLVLAALLISTGMAQAADAVFPRGSLFGLVPPEGMVESPGFSGFEDRARGASILIVEMPAEAYDQVAAGFTDAALASKGITVLSRGTLPIADTRTLFVTGTQALGGLEARKWILLAGRKEGTALITVQLPQASAAALPDEAVRKALESLAFRPPPSIEQQVAALPFRLTDLAGFRPVRVIGNTALLLTDGPKDIIEKADQAIIVVGIAPGAPREDDRQQFALRALSSVPGVKDLRIDRAEPLRINGQPGFEILATGKDASGTAEVRVVQWLRFGNSGHVRMVGVVSADAFSADYPRLRAVRDGLDTR